jgi:hypothetical protein
MILYGRLWTLFVVAGVIAAAPAFAAGVRDVQASIAEAEKTPDQGFVVRTTGGIDTSGWVLIAVLHGPDAALVREGQMVRAFSVNARTRMHQALVTRVTPQQNGVRVEATLAERVLGVSTRYLMEIVTDSI